MTQESTHKTPEFSSVLKFLRNNAALDPDSWPKRIPSAREAIRRITSKESQILLQSLTEGEGFPVIITDALDGMELQIWLTFENLKAAASHLPVVVNNRAPARHADALPGGGGSQQTKAMLLGDYFELLESLPDSLTGYLDVPDEAGSPFYLNGWRAFLEVDSLPNDCPLPSFSSVLDDTVALLEAIDAKLFGGTSTNTSAIGGQTSSWCNKVDANLTKLFVGPPGTVTRLHVDAGDAHGWLAQGVGCKLFILYPPSDGVHLDPLETEKETVQSAIDPLNPDMAQWPKYRQSSPVACVLHPGEAILIPRGWWHYAVSLERSVTLQRNFYHAESNAAGLVKMVMKTATALTRK